MGAETFDIRFLGQAGLKITRGQTTFLTDPWLSGPAYEEQWYLYPLPDRSVRVDDVNYIWYSHGHEDHLHEGTFDLLPKDAAVLLTKQWFTGNRQWLIEHGFADVREITSGHWVELGEDLSIVSLVNRSDSLSIIRTSREVIVNVNDALHCYDDACIDFYCHRILSLLKGRRIDYVFCGFAGASYFPNCLRHPHKDDVAVARAREQHFVSGFARITKHLSPRMAFGFAAGAVLLEPFNHWINEIKLSNDPVEVTTELMPEMHGRVFKLRPGDRIADGDFHPGDVPVPADPVADYQSVYAAEIRAKRERPQIARETGESVLRVVEGNVRDRLNRINADKFAFDWAIRLRDCPDAILRLTLADRRLVATRLTPEQLPEVKDMVLEASSRVLLACVSSRWGGEALQIGYGGISNSDRAPPSSRITAACTCCSARSSRGSPTICGSRRSAAFRTSCTARTSRGRRSEWSAGPRASDDRLGRSRRCARDEPLDQRCPLRGVSGLRCRPQRGPDAGAAGLLRRLAACCARRCPCPTRLSCSLWRLASSSRRGLTGGRAQIRLTGCGGTGPVHSSPRAAGGSSFSTRTRELRSTSAACTAHATRGSLRG